MDNIAAENAVVAAFLYTPMDQCTREIGASM